MWNIYEGRRLQRNGKSMKKQKKTKLKLKQNPESLPKYRFQWKEREPIVQLKCGKFKFLPNKGSKHPKRKSFLFYS